MNNIEFSAEFDILYNNVTSNKAPGLDEYEKSVFLTKAQEMLIKEDFNKLTDISGRGVDGNPIRHYDFSNIIDTKPMIKVSNTEGITKIDPRSALYEYPDNILFILNETIRDSLYLYHITPLSHEEYQRLIQQPYALPRKREVWKLLNTTQERTITSSSPGALPAPTSSTKRYNIVEIIGKYNNTPTYNVRFIRKPSPIILDDLNNYGTDLNIDGEVDVQNPVCELPEYMHREILERAITLAKIAWQGGSATQVQQSKE